MKNLNFRTINDKSKSFNIGTDEDLGRRIVKLKKSSNFDEYEKKLQDLKLNPINFESFSVKIKNELKKRFQEFEEIKSYFFN